MVRLVSLAHAVKTLRISMKRILIIGVTSTIAEHCARIWAARGDAMHLVARNDNTFIMASDLKVRGLLR